MPEIKFYYARGACSLAPHILLRELGVKFDAIRLRVGIGPSEFPEEFRRINPKMRVPVIVLDGNAVTEIPAIATIISSFAPERGIMGRTLFETAAVYEWINWLSGTLHSTGFGHYFRPQRFSADPNASDGIKKRARELIKDCFEFIEGKLTGIYAVGSSLTAVDPFLFVFYRWGNDIGFHMRDYPKYTRLAENLAKRSAVNAALEAERITSTL